jgi:hypothetical protein
MSLRDRVKQRARPSVVWPLRIDPLEVVERAQAEVVAAEDEVLVADGTPELGAAKERVKAARQAFAACFEPITLTALTPPEYEALLAEHPGKDGANWGKDFPRALFLACVQGELDRDEWAVFLDSEISAGERAQAFNTALAINIRMPDFDLPKDWTSTRS